MITDSQKISLLIYEKKDLISNFVVESLNKKSKESNNLLSQHNFNDVNIKRFLPETFSINTFDYLYNTNDILISNKSDFIEEPISVLIESIQRKTPDLLLEYVTWLNFVFSGQSLSSVELIELWKSIDDSLKKILDFDYYSYVKVYLSKVIDKIPSLPSIPNSYIKKDNPLYNLAQDYISMLLKSKRNEAFEMVSNSIKSGIFLKDIYLNVFQVCQYEIGRLWQMNKISEAQEHYVTASTQLIMSKLYPYVFSSNKNGKKLVATGISEDLHEIGIRMVADFFEMEGWNTYYLGSNTPTKSIISFVYQHNPDILAVSATMYYNVKHIESLISEIRKESNLNNLKIIVGGYPFISAQDLWKKIGADGFTEDAQEAVKLANDLTKDL